MNIPRHFISLLFVLGLSGCLQIERLVHLAPDGSGTVEQTVIVRREVIAQLEAMAAKRRQLPRPDPVPQGMNELELEFKLINEDKLKAAAERMGEGVNFVSAKRIENKKGAGFVAIFAFKDLNTVKLDHNVGEEIPTLGGNLIANLHLKPVTFKFNKDAPAELIINFPPLVPPALLQFHLPRTRRLRPA